MRGRWIFVLAALVAFAGAIANAETKSAILGSPHDLRINTTTGDACIACHTPHGSNPDAKALLWQRAVRTAYAVYDATVNPDFAGGAVDLTLGNKASLLCLSCHDGAVATNMSHQNTAIPGIQAETAPPVSSGGNPNDLTTTHPVGFTYATSVTAKPTDYLATPGNGVKLFVGTVQCGSCHQAHDNTNDEFLRVSNTGSALCLSCHV
ncbi:MAG TPA: cytochrome c3 family protein [Vicinamibacterales bacterium]|nr:cytochrome c3 family protein [Vicinamibacterales bacterium]